MPQIKFYKQLNFMKPNNKGTKNLTWGTAPAKVAVAGRRRCVAKTVVDSTAKELTKFHK